MNDKTSDFDQEFDSIEKAKVLADDGIGTTMHHAIKRHNEQKEKVVLQKEV